MQLVWVQAADNTHADTGYKLPMHALPPKAERREKSSRGLLPCIHEHTALWLVNSRNLSTNTFKVGRADDNWTTKSATNEIFRAGYLKSPDATFPA